MRILLIYSITLFFISASIITASDIARGAHDEKTLFVYQITDGEGLSKIRWFDVENPSDQREIDVPDFAVYAITPSGSQIAFVTTEWAIYILDFRTSLFQHIPVQFYSVDAEHSLIYDEYYLLSRSLLWSPDGSELAFVGVSGEDRADIYTYNVTTQHLTNLTADVPIKNRRIEPSSWSPDGNWLAFVGVLEEVNGRPQPETLVVARDGSQVVRLAPGWRACRLFWSPDNHYLASDTRCFAPMGGTYTLQIFTFDAGSGETSSQSPIVWPGENDREPYYRATRWRDHELVTVHYVPDDEGFSGIEFFQFDIENREETTRFEVPALAGIPYFQGTWAFWVDRDDAAVVHGYDVVTGDTLPNLPISDWCIDRYFFVDAQNTYIALLDGCAIDQSLSIRLFRLIDAEEIHRISSPENDEFIHPLGFAIISDSAST